MTPNPKLEEILYNFFFPQNPDDSLHDSLEAEIIVGDMTLDKSKQPLKNITPNLPLGAKALVAQMTPEEIEQLLKNILKPYTDLKSSLENGLQTNVDYTAIEQSLLKLLKQCSDYPSELTKKRDALFSRSNGIESLKFGIQIREKYLEDEPTSIRRAKTEKEIIENDKRLSKHISIYRSMYNRFTPLEDLYSLINVSISYLEGASNDWEQKDNPLLRLHRVLTYDQIADALYENDIITFEVKNTFELLQEKILIYAAYRNPQESALLHEILSSSKKNQISHINYYSDAMYLLENTIKHFGIAKSLLIQNDRKVHNIVNSFLSEKINMIHYLIDAIKNQSVGSFFQQDDFFIEPFLRFFLNQPSFKRAGGKHLLAFAGESLRYSKNAQYNRFTGKIFFDFSERSQGMRPKLPNSPSSPNENQYELINIFDNLRLLGEPFKDFPLLYLVALYGNRALIEEAVNYFKLHFDVKTEVGNDSEIRKRFQFYLNEQYKRINSTKHSKSLIHCIFTLEGQGFLESKEIAHEILDSRSPYIFHTNQQFRLRIAFIINSLKSLDSEKLLEIREFIRKKPNFDNQHSEKNIHLLQCLYHNDPKLQSDFYREFVNLDSLENPENLTNSDISDLVSGGILTDLATVLKGNDLDMHDVQILIEELIADIIVNNKNDELNGILSRKKNIFTVDDVKKNRGTNLQINHNIISSELSTDVESPVLTSDKQAPLPSPNKNETSKSKKVSAFIEQNKKTIVNETSNRSPVNFIERNKQAIIELSTKMARKKRETTPPKAIELKKPISIYNQESGSSSIVLKPKRDFITENRKKVTECKNNRTEQKRKREPEAGSSKVPMIRKSISITLNKNHQSFFDNIRQQENIQSDSVSQELDASDLGRESGNKYL